MGNPISKNKVLVAVNDIDMLIQRMCPDLNTADEKDRAKLAWWIFQELISGDYRSVIAKNNEESKTQKKDGDEDAQ